VLRRRWQNGLLFLAHFANAQGKVKKLAQAISQEEWEAKQLTPTTMRLLSIKGSPKLSKILRSYGVSMRKIELFLSGYIKESASHSKDVSYVTGDARYILDQGNSIYWKSCQASDPRSRWMNGSSSVSSHYRADEDLLVENYLWCIGEPMHLDGKGYIARAKLRLMYDESDSLAGLYIDRPYGAYSMLLDNQQDLHEWWKIYCGDKGLKTLPIYLAPTWNRENGQENNFEARFGGRSNLLWCPSAEYGYQDTMDRANGPYSFFSELADKNAASWLLTAYTSRPKQDGIYLCALAQVDYNSQKGAFTFPAVSEKPWRGLLTNTQRKIATNTLGLLGKPDDKLYFSSTADIVSARWSGHILYCYEDRITYEQDSIIISGLNSITVYKDLESLGFFKPLTLPYIYDIKTKTLTVQDCSASQKKHGWHKAVPADIPMAILRDRLVVVRDISEEGILVATELPLTSSHG
jgi:hypothetical protein